MVLYEYSLKTVQVSFNLNRIVYYRQELPIFFQPFSLLYNYNDYHVMLYFLDHPEYEAVEAMIRVRDKNEPFIRVIITRHDKTQVDYINQKGKVHEIKKQKIKRETYFVDIGYKKTIIGEKPSILLNFKTSKNEKIISIKTSIGSH